MKFLFLLIFQILEIKNKLNQCKLTLHADCNTIDDYKEIVSINILSYLFEAYFLRPQDIYDLFYQDIHEKRLHKELIPQTIKFLVDVLKNKRQHKKNENSCILDSLIRSIESIQYEKVTDVTKKRIRMLFSENFSSKIKIQNENKTQKISSLCKKFFYIFVSEYKQQVNSDLKFYADVLLISHSFIGEKLVNVNHIFILNEYKVCLATNFFKEKIPRNKTIVVFNFRFTEFLSAFYIKTIKKLKLENFFVNSVEKSDLKFVQKKIFAKTMSFYVYFYKNGDKNNRNFIQNFIKDLNKIEFTIDTELYCNHCSKIEVIACIEYLLIEYFPKQKDWILCLETFFSEVYIKFCFLLMNTILDTYFQKSGNSAFMKNSMIRIYKLK